MLLGHVTILSYNYMMMLLLLKLYVKKKMNFFHLNFKSGLFSLNLKFKSGLVFFLNFKRIAVEVVGSVGNSERVFQALVGKSLIFP